MSLQSAMKAGYKSETRGGGACTQCCHARASKAAPTMKVCRKHEVTVHPRGHCTDFVLAFKR